MKSIYLISLFLFISCHKQDPVPMVQKQICDQEAKAEYTIHNYTEFSKFINSFEDGDAKYLSFYTNYNAEIKPDYLSWAAPTGSM